MRDEMERDLQQAIKDTCDDRNYQLSTLLETILEELRVAPEPAAEADLEPRDTLILSMEHSPIMYLAVWMTPDRTGYQVCLEGAGRYTRAEAEEICREEEGAVAVLEDQAKVFAAPYTVVDYGQIQEVVERLKEMNP